jgi:uncharacterized protein (TIRG00374 family)
VKITIKKNFLASFGKAIVSVSLIAYLISRVGTGEILNIISGVNLYLLIVAFSLCIFGIFVRSLKWRILLTSKKIVIPINRAFTIYFIGTFFNNILPSSIGGDLFRAYELSKFCGSAVESISSIIVERLTGIITLTMIASAAILIGYNDVQKTGTIPIVLFLIGFLGIFSLLLYNESAWLKIKKISFIEHLLIRLNIESKVNRLYDAINAYGKKKNIIIRSFGLSLIFQIITPIIHYFVSLALEIDIDIIYFYIFSPIIACILLIPISVQGIGIREAASVFFYTRVGATEAEAISISIAVYTLVLATGLIGGMIYGYQNIEDIFKKKINANISH